MNGVRDADGNWKKQQLQQFDIMINFTARNGTEEIMKKTGERKRLQEEEVKQG